DMEDHKPGISLATSEGEEVALARVRVKTWVGDDGARFHITSPAPMEAVMAHPPTEAGRTFEARPPRSGTWELGMADAWKVSIAGASTAGVGGLVAEFPLIGMGITALVAQADPSRDFSKTIRTEGYVTLGGVGVATVGAIIWAIGNAHFRKGKHRL